MHGMPEHREADRWSKQPRPLEDGNWVCEDQRCDNVNYPRRTECYKCGKRRGPAGDAVVKAYIEKLKMVKGELPRPARTISSVQRGVMSSGSTLTNELDSWLGAGFEQLPFESPQVYGINFHGCRSTLSAATEGRQLAEHLVACFAASTDPIGDAGEYLASAALWLQTMKSRIRTEEHTLSTSPLVSIGSPTLGGFSNGAVKMLSQPHFGANTNPGATLGVGNMLICSNSSVSNSSGSRLLSRASFRWEDYKDRPSDFLREFGDPAAANTSTMGGCVKPEPGVNGNWECKECNNVNFPRRTSCFQCHTKRGAKGDELVRKYVYSLFDDPGTIWV